MTMRFAPSLLLLVSPFILASCFNKLESSGKTGNTPQYITAADFTGVSYAQNTTHGINVTWPIVANGKNISGYRIYRFQTLSQPPTLVGSVDADTSSRFLSYVDGTVVSGSKYSYQVKAVDVGGMEDSNTALKSAFAWSGLKGYTSSGNNSITLNFDSLTQNIYLKLSIRRIDGTDPTNNASITPSLVAVLTPSNSAMINGSYTFTSYCVTVASDGISCATSTPLLPGAQYQIFGEIFENNGDWVAGPQTYCNSLSYPDCNPFTVSFASSPFQFTFANNGLAVRTLSYGYDLGGDQNNPGWNNVTLVRSFGNSPGTQGSANDITGLFVPKTYQVDLTFKAFNVPAGYIDYEYAVVRSLATVPFDPATLNPSWSASFSGSMPWIPQPYYQKVNSSSGTLGLCPTTSSAKFSTTYMQPCIVVGCDNLPRTQTLDSTYWNSGAGYWTSAAKSLPSDPTISCTDSNAWAAGLGLSKPKYRYTLVMRHFDNASATKIPYNEHLSQSQIDALSVTVAIPPDNMILVNRESVNYEMCQFQLSTAPDPLNHNRCANRVTGDTTLNSGPGKSNLNLPVGYYDFGYNLFVDRYPLTCNWTATSSVATGSFNYQSSGVAGADGSVLYQVATGTSSTGAGTYSNCFVNINGTYQPMNAVVANAGSAASSYFAKALTNAPCDSSASGSCDTSSGSVYTRPKFSYPYWDSTSANAACNSFSDPVYGAKRIPRMREFRAFNAMPISVQVNASYITDPFYSLMNTAYLYSNDATKWRKGACVTNANAGNLLTSISSLPDTNSIPNSLSAQFSSSNKINALTSLGLNFFFGTYTSGVPSFYIGSAGDSDCVSRYGVSNVLDLASTNSIFNTTTSNNTAWYPLSDAAYWNATASTLTGQSSNIDSGNTDLSNDYTTYYYTGYVITAPTTGAYYNLSTYANQNFDYALGLPMTWTSSAYAQNYLTNPTTSNNFYLNQNSAGNTLLTYFPSSTGIFNASGMARWGTGFTPSTGQSSGAVYNSRVRCVLPAE